MTRTPAALDALKAGVLVLAAVIVQLTIVNPLELLDGPADLLLCVLAAVALQRGAMLGASMGFWAGIVIDTASFGTIGLSSLVLTLTGYVVGRWGEGTSARARQLPRVLLAILLATTVSAAVAIVANFILGTSVSLGPVLGRSYAPTLVLNLIAAYPVFLLVRLLLPVRLRERGEVIVPVA